MSRAFSKIAIAQAVIKSIESAFDKYLEMSGDWLDWAPEYFVVCSIADSLYKRMRGNGWVALECPVLNFLDDSDGPGDRRGRRPNALRPEGRFDIALYWKGGSSRAPIEVKHPVWLNKTILGHDAQRLCSALKKGGIQFGMLAFYTSCDEPKRKYGTLKERMDRRRREIGEYLAEIAKKKECTVKLHCGNVVVRDYVEKKKNKKAAWLACCATFERDA